MSDQGLQAEKKELVGGIAESRIEIEQLINAASKEPRTDVDLRLLASSIKASVERICGAGDVLNSGS